MSNREFEKLGNELRLARERAGLVQREVAKHLGYVSSQMVSNWERGLCGPPVRDAAKLCKFIKYSHKSYCELMLDRESARMKRLARAA